MLIKVSDLEAALASEREAKSELERQSTAMEESKARLQNEAASSEAKCRGLAAAAADAEARLESMASERRTLLEMNEDLSVAAQEHLGTISRLLTCHVPGAPGTQDAALLLPAEISPSLANYKLRPSGQKPN